MASKALRERGRGRGAGTRVARPGWMARAGNARRNLPLQREGRLSASLSCWASLSPQPSPVGEKVPRDGEQGITGWSKLHQRRKVIEGVPRDGEQGIAGAGQGARGGHAGGAARLDGEGGQRPTQSPALAGRIPESIALAFGGDTVAARDMAARCPYVTRNDTTMLAAKRMLRLRSLK